MAVKRFTNYEMYNQARRFAGPQRAVFERHASITHLLVHVDGVVAGFQQRPAPLDPILRALRLRAAGLDPRHDDLLGLAHDGCHFLADHARVRGTGNEDAWLAAAKVMWPEGRMHNLKSWTEEGAHAVATGAWLAQDAQQGVRDLLASGTLANGDNLLQVVLDWVAVGTELDQVMQQIRKREQQLGGPRSPYPATRLTFIQLVATLRQTLKMDASVPAVDRGLLLDDLARVEAEADAKRKKSPPDPDADPTQPDAVQPEVVVEETVGGS